MSERYAFIAAEKATRNSPYPVQSMCRWLKVSTSGFYDHERAVPSPRERRRAVVADNVRAAFKRGRGAYGVRRVHAIVTASTDPLVAGCSLNLVRAIMAELGLAGCQPRAYKSTTQADPNAQHTPPDLLGRDFTAETPGVKLVGDITYSAQCLVMCSGRAAMVV